MKYLFILLFFILGACEPPPKPNEPFYCKIDGKKFRPDNGGDVFFEPLLAQINRDFHFFYITANNSKYGNKSMSVSFSITLDSSNRIKPISYKIGVDAKANCSTGYIMINGNNKNHDYKYIENSGKILITKVDSVKQLVSGTFEFEARSIYTDEIVKVTDGCFNDVFYY